MGGFAARAAGLGKWFWTGARDERTVLGRLKSAATGRGGMTRRWALRGVDLTLAPGRALALVGDNGAGKSTLLMLLAGLLAPSEGTAEAPGRVGSFLSPGAGLYPELGVLENVRLVAALYGLTGRALSSRLDAIVAFGELEPYLESRLGELSAGYQARVVFSTALHADFDLLLFDEVFSVGDAAFAARCLQRLRAARAQGAAVALATHSLATARKECDEALLLRAGAAAAAGPAGAVVDAYEEALRA